MSEYLSKEEIKQWRSSLEKITLEEYAARLGKKIEETKPTNDLIDIVLKGKPVVSNTEEYKQTRTERLSSIAERAYEREREIAPGPFSINKILTDETPVKVEKTEKKTVPAKKAAPKSIKKEKETVTITDAMSLMVPYTIAFTIAWLLIILAFYIIGIPLGPGASAIL